MSKASEARDAKAKEMKEGFFKKGILVGRHRDAAQDAEMTDRELKALSAENVGGYGKVLVGGKWFTKSELRKK
jgi:hypothetical protein